MASTTTGSNTRIDRFPHRAPLSGLRGAPAQGTVAHRSTMIVRTDVTTSCHEPSVLRLTLALACALAGMWGFFLCAAGYVFQPAQVGPDHGAWGAIAGLILLPIALRLGR